MVTRAIPFETKPSKRQALALPKVDGREKGASSDAQGEETMENEPQGDALSTSSCSTAASESEAEDTETKLLKVSSVYVTESRLVDRGTRSRETKVRFVEGTKEWNGLRRDRQCFDELIHQFFVLGEQFSSLDVIKLIGIDAHLLGAVSKLMQDLCNRIEEHSKSEDDGVPVLLSGGGRGMKVTAFHHPYLVSLLRVVAEAERIATLGISLGESSDSKEDVSQQELKMEVESQALTA